MSFILDALKKAEAERQRQTGPTLLEVRVAPPRRRFPLWTLVIGALLVINILVLLAFVLRRPAPAPAAAPVAAVPASAAPTAAPILVAAPPSAPAGAAPVSATSPSPVQPAPSVAAAPALRVPPVTDNDRLSADNPADFEPAVPATAASAPPSDYSAAHSARRIEPPSLSDIGGDLPDLRLDLHVYAAQPADRYALINMHRVREGDVLPEGPRVLAIDRDGVELSYRGTEFMLHPQ